MINSNVEESVNGHNIVKLYGQEEKFVEAFRKQNRLLYESSFKAMAVSNLIQPLSRFFTNLNYVIVALGGALRVISGQMTVGDVQAFIQYTSCLLYTSGWKPLQIHVCFYLTMKLLTFPMGMIQTDDFLIRVTKVCPPGFNFNIGNKVELTILING